MSDAETLVLESLQNDVANIGETLRAISKRVISEGISEYPVFIASHEHLDIGKLIFDREEVQLNWFFYASVLEDFIQRKIVLKENVDAFFKTYRDPEEIACIFVIFEEDARFIFIPYEVDTV